MFSYNLVWQLSVLLAIVSSTLIIVSELLSAYYGSANVRVNRKRLNQAAAITTVLFFVTMIFRVTSALLNV